MPPSHVIEAFFANTNRVPKSTADFLKWLKKGAPANFDELIQDAHDEVFDAVDCLECANCCRTVGPAIKDVDIDRLARHTRTKPSVLVDKHMVVDDEGDYVFREHPCPFLAGDNYCTVYDARPRACREYPHTDRRRSLQLLQLHRKNIECCPAVFQVFEILKKRIPWQQGTK